MHLSDDTIQKLSQELQPTIDQVKETLEQSGLDKPAALSVLLVLSAMYLAHMAQLHRHEGCAHFVDEKKAGLLAASTLMAGGPAVITSCLTEWSLTLPPAIQTFNTMAAFDAEVAKHHS